MVIVMHSRLISALINLKLDGYGWVYHKISGETYFTWESITEDVNDYLSDELVSFYNNLPIIKQKQIASKVFETVKSTAVWQSRYNQPV